MDKHTQTLGDLLGPSFCKRLESKGDFEEKLRLLIPGFIKLNDPDSELLLDAFARKHLKLSGRNELIEGMQFLQANAELDLEISDRNWAADSRGTGRATVSESTPAENAAQRAVRRHSEIDPILKALGFSVYRWEKIAGVSSKVGQRYLDGDTTPRVEQSGKLATALGLKELPA